MPVRKTSHGFRHLFAACALAAIFGALPTRAQDISGIIGGTVIDPSDAAIANATVKLVRNATGDAKTQSTNSAGAFSFLDILPGQYTLFDRRGRLPGSGTPEHQSHIVGAFIAGASHAADWLGDRVRYGDGAGGGDSDGKQ